MSTDSNTTICFSIRCTGPDGKQVEDVIYADNKDRMMGKLDAWGMTNVEILDVRAVPRQSAAQSTIQPLAPTQAAPVVQEASPPPIISPRAPAAASSGHIAPIQPVKITPPQPATPPALIPMSIAEAPSLESVNLVSIADASVFTLTRTDLGLVARDPQGQVVMEIPNGAAAARAKIPNFLAQSSQFVLHNEHDAPRLYFKPDKPAMDTVRRMIEGCLHADPRAAAKAYVGKAKWEAAIGGAVITVGAMATLASVVHAGGNGGMVYKGALIGGSVWTCRGLYFFTKGRGLEKKIDVQDPAHIPEAPLRDGLATAGLVIGCAAIVPFLLFGGFSLVVPLVGLILAFMAFGRTHHKTRVTAGVWINAAFLILGAICLLCLMLAPAGE